MEISKLQLKKKKIKLCVRTSNSIRENCHYKAQMIFEIQFKILQYKLENVYYDILKKNVFGKGELKYTFLN